MPNHLSGETSPYLLQHAGNPVDWYPWGPEALGKARTEDKPVFLSIGYSSCHWCHVMERESFEDAVTARFLNEHFVSIKVDREERPDLDAVYMEAVQALTGQGGWPLSAWLSPNGAPFFAGTYFPPTPRQGMPSFRQVLEAVAGAWQTRRADLDQTADAIRAHLSRDMQEDAAAGATRARRPAGTSAAAAAASPPVFAPILAHADDDLRTSVDPKDGGWGGAPKFPPPLVLEYLLARATAAGRPAGLGRTAPEPVAAGSVGSHAALQPGVEVTLDAMAAGGMYDHVGGGFHRYSTDGYWLVPHFEKMLYDNAQLARCYVHAWQSLGKSRYRAVATETLDYLLREMRHPDGAFYSSQDADTSEGEGTFFTWTPAEVRAALEPEEVAAVMEAYGLTERGDFEGRNILHRPARFPAPDPQDPEAEAILGRALAKLLAVRDTRPRPARDDKVLTSWNGLAIAAFADAAAALDSPVYREAAEKAATFVLERLVTAGDTGGDGAAPGAAAGAAGAASPGGNGAPGGAPGATPPQLLHSYKDGRTSGHAFLDDYACLAEGLLALYRCTFDERWFGAARTLTDGLLQRFGRAGGGFYDTSAAHEVLITRPRAAFDSPTPTGTSMAATVLLKMAAYTGEDHYRQAGEQALVSLAPMAERAPVMCGQWLSAALLAQEGVTEIAVVGRTDDPAAQGLVRAARGRYLPLAVLAGRPPQAASQIALLQQREPPAGTPAAAWVCAHSTCSAPLVNPAALEERLTGADGGAGGV